MLVINMKNYLEGSRDEAVRISKTSNHASKKYGVTIAIAPPIGMLSEMIRYHDTIFAQHLDNVDVGSTTGYVVPEIARGIGVIGSLINHSEHRIPASDIKALVRRLKKLDMISVVCVKDNMETRKYLKLNPDYIAIEPPELIGSGRAVSRERPEVIAEAAHVIQEAGNGTKLLCGAGIVSSDDVTEAIKLGSDGIMVASGIIKARNRSKKIVEFTEAISKIKRG